MRVLVYEPKKQCYVKDILGDQESLKNVIGGNIEICYPFHDKIALVCDEDGKTHKKEPNRLIYRNPHSFDILCGTFCIVGQDKEGFCDLTDMQIDKYKRYFKKVKKKEKK